MFKAEGLDPSVKTTLMIAAAITKSPEQSKMAMINFLVTCMSETHSGKKQGGHLLFERNFKSP